MKEIIYIKHPLSLDEKTALTSKYRILDLKFAPDGYKDPRIKPKRVKKATK